MALNWNGKGMVGPYSMLGWTDVTCLEQIPCLNSPVPCGACELLQMGRVKRRNLPGEGLCGEGKTSPPPKPRTGRLKPP